MMPSRHDARDGGHVFTSIGSGSQPTRTSRSWTSNGVHYSVDTTSWSSPGISFGAMTGSATGGLSRSFTTPIRPAVRSGGGGLLGSAIGLFEDMLSMQPQRRVVAQETLGQNPSGRRRVHVEVDSDVDDEDLAYEYEDRTKSRGMFSKLKDKLLDGKNKPRRGDYSSSEEQSPARRSRADQRHSSYRTETREPSLSQQRGRPVDRFVEVDYDDDDEDEEMDFSPPPPRHDSRLNLDMIEALENAVEIERRQVRDCKRRLEQATRSPAISSHHLQRLLDELKGHETAYTNAQANLDAAKAKQRSSRPPRATSYHQAHTSFPQQRHSTRAMSDDLFESFGMGSDPFFGTQSRAQHPDPLFQAFQDMHSFDTFGHSPFGAFDQLFEQMHPGANDAHFRFFTNAGAAPNAHSQRKRTRFSTPSGGTQFPNTSAQFSFTPPPPPPPQPPKNLLKPDEAKRLFKVYNERWNGLPATDANVPYPARGLQASSLSARDSIWAPICSADPSTWSEETVMQANAQAFYLGVVGLFPIYKEAPGTGRIEIGFDNTKANPAQIKVLTDMLKKEKMRWHSDRLGRRNGGTGPTPNEVLQKDERARAVFHAACELMESAQ